jgi:uncharacterized protein (DUF1697 family)
MPSHVAFLRAVNVGKRTVAMQTARETLVGLGFDEVSSYVNSGNLLYSASGSTTQHETAIRAALEQVYGFEITTFVRTAAQVRKLASSKPFGTIAAGHTHFVLMPLRPPTAVQSAAVQELSNDQDEVVVQGRDIHWLIRAKSTETSLGPTVWKLALPDNPTTARNTTMLAKLVERL